MQKPELIDFVNWMWESNPYLISLDEAIEQFKDHMRLKYIKKNMTPALINELVRSIDKEILFNLPAAKPRIEGYWAPLPDRDLNKNIHNYPMPIPNVLTNYDAQLIYGLIMKVAENSKRIKYRGMSYSRITGEKLGNGEYETNDGEWIFPEDFPTHYVLIHKVQPTDAFLGYIGFKTRKNPDAPTSPPPNYREIITARIDYHKANLDNYLKILKKDDNPLGAEFYINNIRETNTRINELQTLLISI